MNKYFFLYLFLYRLDLTFGCINADNDIIVTSGQTCTLDSSQTVDSVQVDGTLVITGNPSDGSVTEISTTSITVSLNGIITADGKGFSSQSGPGAGTFSGSGGKKVTLATNNLHGSH